jgi:Protein of unknown function (DUF1559)
MATGESSTPINGRQPFQYTLRQLLLVIVVCSFGLALVFHWGLAGFVVCYGSICMAALCYGAYRERLDLLAGGAIMFLFALYFGSNWLNAFGHGISGRKSSCANNLHNLTLALQQYHDTFGAFPPAYIADANGRPMHSWRVLILPYLDQTGLYSDYRFDEPWDGPNNRKLHDVVLKVYSCPSRPEKQPKTDTDYVVVVGPQTMWPGEKCTTFADIKDGSSTTIMLVEIHNSGIHWMEPRDLHVTQMPMVINPPRGQGISSAHVHGAQFGFADGSVRFLTDNLPPETLRGALTIEGGEKETLP